MPNFTAGTSFTDGVTNDVTAAKLNALVADAVPTSSLALNSTTGTIATFNSTTGTIPTLVATTLITTGTGTAAAPAIVPTGDTNTGIFFPAADTIAFSEGGAEAVRIDSSGNVGVANTTPSSFYSGANNLVIGSGSGEEGLTIYGGNASASYLAFADGTTGDQAYRGSVKYDHSVDAMSLQTGAAERLRIDSSGNVGIGTASPGSPLVVSRNANDTLTRLILDNPNAGSSAQTILGLSNNGGTAAGLKLGSSAYSGLGGANVLDVFNNVSHTIFSTGGAERLRIDSSGNVIIGTSTVWGVGKTTIESSDLALGLRAGSNNPALVIGKATNNSTTSQVLLQFLHNSYSDGIGQINANGANAAAFGSYSDSRLKENITELPSQLANICLLKPSEFDYKNGSGHQVGFIAQEIQQIYPDVVGEGDGGMLTVTGWSKTEARLVKAIQELKLENDSLKSRIEVLEAA